MDKRQRLRVMAELRYLVVCDCAEHKGAVIVAFANPDER